VTPAEVRRLGALARLHIAPSEARALSTHLSAILRRMEALEPAEAAAAEALGDPGPGPGTPLRSDESAPDPLHSPPARIAPAWADGFFVVPSTAGVMGDDRGSEGAR
jgi:aspartyl/glutamyl-tRNA(Asn/Gln) amidotransferase C subunit